MKRVVVLLVAVAGLTACGGVPGAGPDPCTQISSLNRLVVTRTDDFPRDNASLPLPPAGKVRDAGRAQAVARALCSLLAVPLGTGCRFVSGLGATRWQSDPLWSALAAATGP